MDVPINELMLFSIIYLCYLILNSRPIKCESDYSLTIWIVEGMIAPLDKFLVNNEWQQYQLNGTSKSYILCKASPKLLGKAVSSCCKISCGV